MLAHLPASCVHTCCTLPRLCPLAVVAASTTQCSDVPALALLLLLPLFLSLPPWLLPLLMPLTLIAHPWPPANMPLHLPLYLCSIIRCPAYCHRHFCCCPLLHPSHPRHPVAYLLCCLLRPPPEPATPPLLPVFVALPLPLLPLPVSLCLMLLLFRANHCIK